MFAERDRITIRENCGLSIRPCRRPGPTAPIWLRPSRRDHVQSSCLAADRVSVGGPIGMITSVDTHAQNDAWSTSRCGSCARRHRSLRTIGHSSCHVTALLQCARSRSYCPPRSRMAWAKWREEPVHRAGITTERRPRGQPRRHVEGRAAGLRGGRQSTRGRAARRSVPAHPQHDSTARWLGLVATGSRHVAGLRGRGRGQATSSGCRSQVAGRLTLGLRYGRREPGRDHGIRSVVREQE